MQWRLWTLTRVDDKEQETNHDTKKKVKEKKEQKNFKSSLQRIFMVIRQRACFTIHDDE